MLGLCGCQHVQLEVRDAGNGVPLSEFNRVGVLEKFVAGDDLTVMLEGGYAPELPAPLDLVISELHTKMGGSQLIAIRPKAGGIVNEWNLYALDQLFSGRSLPARDVFLKNRFGAAAPAMSEYFRLLERRMVAAGALCGAGRGERPCAYDLYSGNFLSALADILARAEQTADTPEARVAVRREQEFFASRRKAAEARLERERRRLTTGDPPQRFTDLYGNPADIETTIRLAADGEKLTIFLHAAETLPADRRISQTRSRDYADLWAEDGFEIFLVPDANRPAHGWQFIVNSRGVLWDAEHTRVGACDPSWSAPHAAVRFTEGPGFWQAELTVPWRDLGYPKQPDRPFSANVYRNRAVRGIPRRSYAWSPIYSGAYYQPERFGRFFWREDDK